ncbi:MAG TPA: universal stress protein [Gemmatimonadaceae bacterium]|nr:universal stress protein [Gemmatimonadaceae bacterium]
MTTPAREFTGTTNESPRREEQTAPAAAHARPPNPWRRGPLVVALHGEESTSAPLSVVRRLSRRLDLPLRVVTVVEYEAVPLGRSTAGTVPSWVVRELGMPRREMMTQRLHEALGESGWTLDVRYGSPAREIAAAADEIDATLIVVDASPHRRVRRSVAGVRALQVIRHGSCPVLSVAPGGDELPRRIVASVDFSPASTRAVQTALLLAGDAATLSLAHVPFPFRLEHPLRDAGGGLIGGDVGAAFEQLLESVRPHAPHDLTIETKELSGKIADAMLSHAESMQADLLATGAHGPTAVERFFVGSVATNLLHLAECSVLAAPAPRARGTGTDDASRAAD